MPDLEEIEKQSEIQILKTELQSLNKKYKSILAEKLSLKKKLQEQTIDAISQNYIQDDSQLEELQGEIKRLKIENKRGVEAMDLLREKEKKENRQIEKLCALLETEYSSADVKSFLQESGPHSSLQSAWEERQKKMTILVSQNKSLKSRLTNIQGNGLQDGEDVIKKQGKVRREKQQTLETLEHENSLLKQQLEQYQQKEIGYRSKIDILTQQVKVQKSHIEIILQKTSNDNELIKNLREELESLTLRNRNAEKVMEKIKYTSKGKEAPVNVEERKVKERVQGFLKAEETYDSYMRKHQADFSLSSMSSSGESESEPMLTSLHL